VSGANGQQYMMHLTATERKLIERYRQQLQGGADPSGAGVLPHETRSRSLPKERPRGRYLTPVAESVEECVSDGEDTSYVRGVQSSLNSRRGAPVDGKTVLEGGSFIETFDPPKASTRSSGLRLPKTMKGVPSGGKKVVKKVASIPASMPAIFAEADQTLTESLPVHRGPIGVTHASLFGQIRHFRNPETEERNTEIRREPQREARGADAVTPNLPI